MCTIFEHVKQLVCHFEGFLFGQSIQVFGGQERSVLKAYMKTDPCVTHLLLAHLILLPGQKDAESDEEHACGKGISGDFGVG